MTHRHALLPTLVLLLVSCLERPAAAQRPQPSPQSEGTRRAGPGAGRETAISSSSLCVGSLEDQAGGACLRASSTPQLGQLFPLGSQWMIDAQGRVGLGTLTPSEALDVAGVVRAASGGFRFPDGTLQTSAALPVDADPSTALGLVSIPALACPGGAAPIYTLTHSVARPFAGGTPQFSLSFSKDVDGCSAALVNAVLGQGPVGDVILSVGSDTLTARQAQVVSVELESDGRGLPRERVSLIFGQIEYDHGAGTSFGQWSLGTSTGSAQPSFAGQALSFVLPDTAPVPAGSYPILGTLHGVRVAGAVQYDDLVLERQPDVASPSLWLACAAGHQIPTLEARRMRWDPAAAKDVPYLQHQLTGARVTAVRWERDPIDGWRETLTIQYTTAKWEFLVNGVTTTAP